MRKDEYGVQDRFRALEVPDASTLLVWLKSAHDAGATGVLFSPVVDGLRMKPTAEVELADVIWDVRQLVAGLGMV